MEDNIIDKVNKIDKEISFIDAIEDLINRQSRENESNTPDFILAKYLLTCLEAFEEATRSRDEFFGVDV